MRIARELPLDAHEWALLRSMYKTNTLGMTKAMHPHPHHVFLDAVALVKMERAAAAKPPAWITNWERKAK